MIRKSLLAGLLVIAAWASVAGAPGTAHAAQPIEGVWLAPGGRAAIVVKPVFDNFEGTVLASDRRATCPYVIGTRQWFIAGRGRTYRGTVPTVTRFGCRPTGPQAPALWKVTADGSRLQFCVTRRRGPSLPVLDKRGKPLGDTVCGMFTRIGAGALGGVRRTCFRYQVIGVRGSGEPLSGPYAMGATVGPTAGSLRRALDSRSLGLYSLPYPAAPVSALLSDLGRPFFDSIDRGVRMLDAFLVDLTRRCPRTRVALIGYSQGAAVVSEAVRGTSDEARRRIRAVVLFADPYSAGASSYSVTPSPFPGGRPRRNGFGGLGSRAAALPARTTDICFANDLVCDRPPTPWSSATLYEALSSKVHTTYKQCCRLGRYELSLTARYGGEATSRLRR